MGIDIEWIFRCAGAAYDVSSGLKVLFKSITFGVIQSEPKILRHVVKVLPY